MGFRKKAMKPGVVDYFLFTNTLIFVWTTYLITLNLLPPLFPSPIYNRPFAGQNICDNFFGRWKWICDCVHDLLWCCWLFLAWSPSLWPCSALRIHPLTVNRITTLLLQTWTKNVLVECDVIESLSTLKPYQHWNVINYSMVNSSLKHDDAHT